jgi:hypothetical protein
VTFDADDINTALACVQEHHFHREDASQQIGVACLVAESLVVAFVVAIAFAAAAAIGLSATAASTADIVAAASISAAGLRLAIVDCGLAVAWNLVSVAAVVIPGAAEYLPALYLNVASSANVIYY